MPLELICVSMLLASSYASWIVPLALTIEDS